MTIATADYYKVLGVGRNAGFAAIKRAYFRRAKECHPDRFGGSRAKENEFKQLVQAFNVLSDPLQRRDYDSLRLDKEGRTTGAATDGDVPLHFGFDKDAVMDSAADDTLEEMIVGNTIPRDTTIGTLMRDLEQTEKFCRFREAKNLFYAGRVDNARALLEQSVAASPGNILYRYYLGECLRRLGKLRASEKHLRTALQLGLARRPPQRLERVRRALSRIRNNHRSVLGRVLSRPIPEPPAAFAPEDKLRHAVGRHIDDLAAEQERNSRRRLTAGATQGDAAVPRR